MSNETNPCDGWCLPDGGDICVGAARSFELFRTSPVPGYAPLEVRSVFPRETSPGKYEQVRQEELQSLATQGWELVSVMPYIYRNEEHGPETPGPRPVVTQTYPAYFFKRLRVGGLRE